MPAIHNQADREISDNDIDDNDFSKELPFEAEYYRTSTDKDGFVRPIANPEENDIDEGDGGIDLDEPNIPIHTPDCTYHIAIRLFYESICDLQIKLAGLTVKSGTNFNISSSDFVQQAQLHIFNTIKGKNLTNELVDDVIKYLRQTFTRAFGYEDNCSVSTTVVTYFTKNDTQVDTPRANEETTDVLKSEENTQSETEANGEDVTEEYRTRTLTRPKLSAIIQNAIDVYKALYNWKYRQQS